MASAEQEDSQLDSRAGSGGKRDIVKWTERMEEAYEAALKQLGGLDNAKPKAVYDLLAHEFPVLSVQNVKWHIQTHRKREEMRKHKPADYQGPTRWVGRLEEAYEAEVARQGGLHSARPKALLEALQPEFPELTLQIIKWHLQLQRRKDQQQRQARQSQQGPAQSDTAAMQGGSAPAQAPGRHALAASGPAMRAAPSTLAHGEVQQGASAMSSGSADGPGMPATSMPPLSAAAAAAAARVAHARQAPGSTPSPAASTGRQASLPVSQQPSLMTSQAYRSQQGWGAASLPPAPQQLGCPQASQQAQQQQQRGEQPQQAHVLLEHILQGHGPPSLQPQQPGTPSGSRSGQASQAGSLLHSAAAGLQAGLPGGLNPQLQVLSEQQLEQQRRLELAHRQQQQQLLTQLLQAQQRTAPPPWTPFLLPAAQAALEEATATRDRCLHIVGSLRQRAAELSELLQVLAAAGTVGSGPTGAGCQSDLEALLPLAEGLLPATLLHGAGAGATYASRGGGRGWAAMAAAGGPATRRQRTLASLAASFPTVRDDAAAASWASGI